jgi:NADPH:quinone reductase-like Zn-dependent oxidoreductase
MKAALVEHFGTPPRYADVDPPSPREGEVRVRVHAAALSQLVRSQAAGKHYSKEGSLPFVPGADGVGRLDDGARVYFAFPRAPHGTMAEETVVLREHCVAIGDDVDDVTAAAIANPGMSSWAALHERARFRAGETVLVLGATGASGRLAVAIAKHLGARRVIAAGRDAARLESLRALGADALVPIEGDAAAMTAAFRKELAAGVDVVLDYLWGPPAQHLLEAASGLGPTPLRYVQIGSMAGASIAMSAAPLRNSGLELVGSGLGSIPKARLVAAAGAVLGAMSHARLSIHAKAVPLRDVADAWGHEGERLVFTMGSV